MSRGFMPAGAAIESRRERQDTHDHSCCERSDRCSHDPGPDRHCHGFAVELTGLREIGVTEVEVFSGKEFAGLFAD